MRPLFLLTGLATTAPCQTPATATRPHWTPTSSGLTLQRHGRVDNGLDIGRGVGNGLDREHVDIVDDDRGMLV